MARTREGGMGGGGGCGRMGVRVGVGVPVSLMMVVAVTVIVIVIMIVSVFCGGWFAAMAFYCMREVGIVVHKYRWRREVRGGGEGGRSFCRLLSLYSYNG